MTCRSAEAKPFDCSHTARRHPKETKGQDYNVDDRSEQMLRRRKLLLSELSL